MSKKTTNNTNLHYRRNILIWIVAVSIAIYGGMGLGSLDIWEDTAVLRKFCLGIGGVASFILSWVMPLRTLKKKGYVNLLWLGLVVPVLTAVDLMFRFFFGVQHF